MSPPSPQTPATTSTLGVDLASVAICSVIWGTTWYVITFQFGSVPVAWSVAYRFGLGALVLFIGCALAKFPLGMTPRQHGLALMQGLFTFAINYVLVYAAEQKLLSGVVAVIFASMSFINLIMFRIFEGRRASALAWGAALCGMAGVCALSMGELFRTGLNPGILSGFALAIMAVTGSAIGNLFASGLGRSGVPVIPSTTWAMAYGTALLVLWALVTGQVPSFDPTPRYVLSLLYLSIFGSVIAFVVYFTLARRRSYTFATYISALTPLTAVLISAVFEQARWGWAALAGLVLVVAGQILLIKAPKS